MEGSCRPFVTCLGAPHCFLSYHLYYHLNFFFFFFDTARTSNRAFSPVFQGREVVERAMN
jgi:hypothetical protein